MIVLFEDGQRSGTGYLAASTHYKLCECVSGTVTQMSIEDRCAFLSLQVPLQYHNHCDVVTNMYDLVEVEFKTFHAYKWRCQWQVGEGDESDRKSWGHAVLLDPEWVFTMDSADAFLSSDSDNMRSGRVPKYRRTRARGRGVVGGRGRRGRGRGPATFDKDFATEMEHGLKDFGESPDRPTIDESVEGPAEDIDLDRFSSIVPWLDIEPSRLAPEVEPTEREDRWDQPTSASHQSLVTSR